MKKNLVNQILSLPLEDRAELADIILKSLNTAIDPEIEDSWKQEIMDRFDAYNKGEIKSVDGEEFILKLRRKIKK
jgi:putative addiction module component (TIGR02574 family)